jgi:hypothetical protein
MRTRLVTLGVFVLAAAAQNVAFMTGYQGVRVTLGATGPMCPTLWVRILSSTAYLVLLATLTAAVGWAAGKVGRVRSRTSAMVNAAILSTAAFLVLQNLSSRLAAIRAIATTDIGSTAAALAWGHAGIVAIGVTIGFAYHRATEQGYLDSSVKGESESSSLAR